MTSLAIDWNPGHDPKPQTGTAAAFLTETLHAQLAPGGGLRAFAGAVGLDVDNPAERVRVAGRPADLPNPLALVRGIVGHDRGPLTFFSATVTATSTCTTFSCRSSRT